LRGRRWWHDQLDAELLADWFTDPICFFHVFLKITTVLPRNRLAGSLDVRDSGFLFVRALLILVHGLFSRIVRSGVTISGAT
jgi:hypothetical protein